MAEAKLKANSDDFDDLVYEVATSARQYTMIYNYFIHSAMRSAKTGQDAIAWVRMTEAFCKSYMLIHPDSRIMTDKFIFSVAMELAEYFAVEIQRNENGEIH